MKNWSTVKKIAFGILVLVIVVAVVTGLGYFDWMERVFDPNNTK